MDWLLTADCHDLDDSDRVIKRGGAVLFHLCGRLHELEIMNIGSDHLQPTTDNVGRCFEFDCALDDLLG